MSSARSTLLIQRFRFLIDCNRETIRGSLTLTILFVLHSIDGVQRVGIRVVIADARSSLSVSNQFSSRTIFSFDYTNSGGSVVRDALAAWTNPYQLSRSRRADLWPIGIPFRLITAPLRCIYVS